jgi:hypothetical protein
MKKDPIVEEIHKTREQIAREYDHDVNRILNHLRKKEIENSDRVVYKRDNNEQDNSYQPTSLTSTRTLHPTSNSIDAPDLSEAKSGVVTLKL